MKIKIKKKKKKKKRNKKKKKKKNRKQQEYKKPIRFFKRGLITIDVIQACKYDLVKWKTMYIELFFFFFFFVNFSKKKNTHRGLGKTKHLLGLIFVCMHENVWI